MTYPADVLALAREVAALFPSRFPDEWTPPAGVCRLMHAKRPDAPRIQHSRGDASTHRVPDLLDGGTCGALMDHAFPDGWVTAAPFGGEGWVVTAGLAGVMCSGSGATYKHARALAVGRALLAALEDVR